MAVVQLGVQSVMRWLYEDVQAFALVGDTLIVLADFGDGERLHIWKGVDEDGELTLITDCECDGECECTLDVYHGPGCLSEPEDSNGSLGAFTIAVDYFRSKL